MTDDVRTIDAALDRFELIDSAGDGDKTACAMTAISWVAGEAWTDHPECAHRILADLAIKANDAEGTTAEQRAAIVRAGETGLIDTWWIPATVIVWCIAQAPKDATPLDRCLTTLAAVTAWKRDKQQPDLRGAYLGDADLGGAYLGGANLGGAYLGGADLRGAYLGGAYLGGAYLRDADLCGAYLRGAYLCGADLRGAYLGGAYLRDADLCGARGDEWTLLPAGWHVDEGSGLVVADAEDAS